MDNYELSPHKNLLVGMVLLCDFNFGEKRLFSEMQTEIVEKFQAKKDNDKIIKELNEAFADEDIKKLAEKQLHPEIWKFRPVLVIHLYRRKGMTNSAIVLPLTSTPPWSRSAVKNTVFWPFDKKPEIMKSDNSWVLCDMPYHVSISRLQKYQRNKKVVDVFIDKETYKLAIKKYKKIIADEIS